MPCHRSQNIAAKRSSTVAGPTKRACINCRQRKIRCDIVDKGVPCTNCSTYSRPGCRLSPNKKESRQLLGRPAILAPLRPRESADSSATSSPLPAETFVSTTKEDGEQDLGAHLLNRNDTRGAELGHRTRSHFIGSELSNCHYLVRQSSSDLSYDKVFHFSNGQWESGEAWYKAHGIPDEICKRPEKQLEVRLIRAYFELVNRGWPIVDQELFMAQYQGQDPKNPVCLTLLNAILLVGAHALASHDETMIPLLPVFFRKAKVLVESDSGHDRLAGIQVPLLMTWYSDVNAWHWIGIAIRTAMALGVHRDVSHSAMLPVYKRTYTRLWWILFQFDTISATSAGRPQVINLADSDVPDLQYADFEGVPGAEMDFMIHQIKLCKVISQTIRDGWSPRASMETRLQAIQRADETLGDLMLGIPERLQLKLSNLDIWQSVLHLTYYNFVLLLHHPAPNSSPKDTSAKAHEDAILCREATIAIASIFEALLNKRAISSLWLYSNHVLFTATIYILNQINTSTPLLAAKSRRILDTFLTSLRELAKYWTYAKGLLQVLEQRVSKLKSQRHDAASARSEYAEPPGQLDNLSFNPQPNSPTEISSHRQPSEVSSGRNGGVGQISIDSGAGLADLGSDAHATAADFNTSMGFQGASQDPLLDDLFLLDASAFDFHFYENIG
ncbi:related to cutinase transcription factor 1 beta [Fusarium torulosum]|uniref:Related to cutinase transcription factor 1 beta n=1 Tax=Fusarium torulosum TaxID=33205 RepID=A0AAE8M445_9HYPO|nr:related to cutinase transcription factor 1 beta [Fusarium torulosum]